MTILRRAARLSLLIALAAAGCKDKSVKPAADLCAPSSSVVIVVDYPGASVSVVEHLVVEPIEAALHGVSAVQRTFSSAREGRAEVQVFVAGDAAMPEVLRVLQGMTQLPADVAQPVVFAQAPVAQTVLIAISGEATAVELLSVAQQLRQRLITARDVTGVAVVPDGDAEIEIAVDPTRLRALGLTFDPVETALRAESVAPAGGLVVRGMPTDLAAIGDVVLNEHGVRVRDIASIRETSPRLRARVDGKPAVLLAVAGARGAELTQLATDAVHALSLPDGLAASVLPPVSVTACGAPPASVLASPAVDGAVVARAMLPPGTEREDAARVADAVAAAAAACGATHTVSAHGARLFPALPGETPSEEAYAEVAVFAPAARADECARTWRGKLDGLPGMQISMSMPGEVSIVMGLSHPDVSVLDAVAARAVAATEDRPALRARTLSRATQPSVSISLSPAGRALGLTPQAVARTVRVYGDGVEVARLFDAHGARAVRVRARPTVESPDALGHIMLHTPGGADVPLAQVADIALTAEPSALHRIDGRRTAFVEFRVAAAGEATARLWLVESVATALRRSQDGLDVSVY